MLEPAFVDPLLDGNMRFRLNLEIALLRVLTVVAPQGALDIRNGGIVANPNPYDAEEIADGAVKIPAKPDDGLWRLMPATDACEIE